MDARARVLEHFRNLPNLNFEHASIVQLNYVEPGLQRSDGVAESFLQRKEGRNLHKVLQELFTCLERGVSKLEYGRTSDLTWQKYMRFSSERLIGTKSGYAVGPIADQSAHYVNATASSASRWFMDQLIPTLRESSRKHAFLLGDPGAGKSTLVKYLINTNFESLLQQRVVVSRFEFLKFYYHWYRGFGSIEVSLADYISYVLVRDIIYFHAYIRDDDANHQRTDVGPFAAKVIGATIRAAAKGRSVDRKTIAAWIRNISAVLEPNGLNLEALQNIPPRLRVLLIQHFASSRTLILVLDGLDCISIEDRQFETERAQVLKYIIHNRTRLTDLNSILDELDVSDGLSGRVRASLLFVMRENTFYLYQSPELSDVKIHEQLKFRVQNIDPRVAIFNAVTRAADYWAETSGADEEQAQLFVQAIMDAILLTVDFINHTIGAGDKPQYVLNLFAGNIRTLFTFLVRLLEWFVEDAMRSDELTLENLTSVASVLKIMTGPAGFHLLRQRSYRIIEILLFAGIPWFENAIVAKRLSSYATAISPDSERVGTFSENVRHTGFVDNIFNYHVSFHDNDRDKHSLLEKIRVVQLLRNRKLNPSELERDLFQRLGYKSPNLDSTIAILVRTQMVHAVIRDDREVYLTATDRGLLVIDYLAQTMSYLEHVFHRTLFPDALVSSIRDNARTSAVEVWTAASIRNVYVFLTYLRHVENNRASGKAVPDDLRIFARTHEKVQRSLDRIFADPVYNSPDRSVHEKLRRRERREVIAAGALKGIERILKQWEWANCITGSTSEKQPKMV